MSAKILLPVRAHIKKYLMIQYGQQLCLSDRGTIAFLLSNMLEHHKKSDPGTVRPSQKLIDNKSYFGYEVFIGDKYERALGLYLSTKKIKDFNDSVDDMIREEMYRWCHHPNATDYHVDFNIHRFRDFYGISEDELPFDNLKRWYYRERERLTERRKEKPLEAQLILSY